MTETEWVHEETSLQWLQHFEKYRIPGPCVLILAGHVSFISVRRNQRISVCPRSHTTHRLQPRDRSFIETLKNCYTEARNNFLNKTVGEKKITKFKFSFNILNCFVQISYNCKCRKQFLVLWSFTFDASIVQAQQDQIAALIRRFISCVLLLQKLEKYPIVVDRSKNHTS